MVESSRLEQFKKMATDDPDNELGHFSLGKAYLDAGEFTDALTSLDRAVALNPKLTRAYLMAGIALLQLGRKQEAIDRLTQGVALADERGEYMPRDEMAAMLREAGAPVPAFKASVTAKAAGEGEVHCIRCGRIGRHLPRPPFSNDQGRQIFEKVCADCWREWIGMGTKVINELHLPLSDPQAQKVYDQHMKEFLNLR